MFWMYLCSMKLSGNWCWSKYKIKKRKHIVQKCYKFKHTPNNDASGKILLSKFLFAILDLKVHYTNTNRPEWEWVLCGNRFGRVHCCCFILQIKSFLSVTGKRQATNRKWQIATDFRIFNYFCFNLRELCPFKRVHSLDNWPFFCILSQC